MGNFNKIEEFFEKPVTKYQKKMKWEPLETLKKGEVVGLTKKHWPVPGSGTFLKKSAN